MKDFITFAATLAVALAAVFGVQQCAGHFGTKSCEEAASRGDFRVICHAHFTSHDVRDWEAQASLPRD